MYAAHLYILRSLLVAYEDDRRSCPRPPARTMTRPRPEPERRHPEAGDRAHWVAQPASSRSNLMFALANRSCSSSGTRTKPCFS